MSEVVYHYTKAENALKILFLNEIRLGRFGETNDIREFGKSSISDIIELDEGDLSNIDSEKICRSLKMDARIFCVAMYDPKRPRDVKDSWFAPYARLRMWAQYGEIHKGVCLGFDFDKLNRAIERCKNFKNIIYFPSGYIDYQDYKYDDPKTMRSSEIIQYGVEEYIKKYLLDNYKKLYFQKSYDWKNEVEYRWVVFCPHAEDFFINYPKDALVEIIVSENIERFYDKCFEKYAKASGVDYYMLDWDQGEPFRRKLIKNR